MFRLSVTISGLFTHQTVWKQLPKQYCKIPIQSSFKHLVLHKIKFVNQLLIMRYNAKWTAFFCSCIMFVVFLLKVFFLKGTEDLFNAWLVSARKFYGHLTLKTLWLAEKKNCGGRENSRETVKNFENYYLNWQNTVWILV